VTAGNVAFYTLQHMKSGRRTVGYSGVDVLASGTQLNGRSTVSSIHEEVPMSSETDETVPVSELMSTDHEDPSTKATRKLAWQHFYRTQDRNGRQLLTCIAEGQSPKEIAGQLKLTRLAIRQQTDQLRTAVKSFFGAAVIAEVCRAPQWFNDLRAVKEHLACRGERSWQTH
jgi:DNA-binding CsgD family transcriptional regulator